MDWRRKWQPIPVFLPGKFHGQRSLVGYSPWGCRVRHDWTHTHTPCPHPCLLLFLIRLLASAGTTFGTSSSGSSGLPWRCWWCPLGNPDASACIALLAGHRGAAGGHALGLLLDCLPCDYYVFSMSPSVWKPPQPFL